MTRQVYTIWKRSFRRGFNQEYMCGFLWGLFRRKLTWDSLFSSDLVNIASTSILFEYASYLLSFDFCFYLILFFCFFSVDSSDLDVYCFFYLTSPPLSPSQTSFSFSFPVYISRIFLKLSFHQPFISALTRFP